jgi:hypothetical protein
VLVPVPRVTVKTRALFVAEIDEKGTDAFTMEAIDELEKTNPELLQMAHNFASTLGNYLHAMQGFALCTSPSSFNRRQSARACTDILHRGTAALCVPDVDACCPATAVGDAAPAIKTS